MACREHWKYIRIKPDGDYTKRDEKYANVHLGVRVLHVAVYVIARWLLFAGLKRFAGPLNAAEWWRVTEWKVPGRPAKFVPRAGDVSAGFCFVGRTVREIMHTLWGRNNYSIECDGWITLLYRAVFFIFKWHNGRPTWLPILHGFGIFRCAGDRAEPRRGADHVRGSVSR